jgi:CBS-domain-containing membrane protein
LAASLSILGMFALRFLHSQEEAVAMILVLRHVMHFNHAIFSVMVVSILLVMAGTVYRNLMGKRHLNRKIKLLKTII